MRRAGASQVEPRFPSTSPIRRQIVSNQQQRHNFFTRRCEGVGDDELVVVILVRLCDTVFPVAVVMRWVRVAVRIQ